MSTKTNGNDPTIVCGIGASAGGLAPVEEFFDAMPSDTGIAFVVVQHLSPDHESMMVSLLSNHTGMDVTQAVDGASLEANKVYLISPGTQLEIVENVFVVSDRDSDSKEIPRPIDIFFKSIAVNYGPNSIAIVLSGTGSDGTLGVEEVRRVGGITLAQDSSAAFEGMPVAAQRSGNVDSVLDPTSLAIAVEIFARTGRRPNDGPEPMLEPEEVSILTHIASTNEIDFREYKPGTIHRRLQRRLLMSGFDAIGEYAAVLRKDADERSALIEDLFIDVTSFFRDPDAFLLVENDVMPQLAERAASEGRPIRIWTPGCATGEEAYSLTMLAMEAAERAGISSTGVQTFATDVHSRALDHAAAGIYSAERMERVSPARREKFFLENDGEWTIKKHVRSAVTFAKHNLLTDAPFTRVDMVSCRNLLIYFRAPAQERAIASMGFALRQGGTLFLGSSETIGFAAPDYSTVSATWRLYTKESDSIERGYRRDPPMRTDIVVPTQTRRSTTDPAVLRAYDAMLAEQFAAGLLVDDQRKISYILGGAASWIQQPPGRPTEDVLSLVSDANLRLIIGATLRELETGAATATPRPLGSLYRDSEGNSLALLGKRLTTGASRSSYLLYVAPPIAPVDVPVRPLPPLANEDEEAAFLVLEEELRHTRESLQSSLEEQETSNEELNAANEELIASNEELQSTNEELSSVNEELRTLNDEHQRRLDQVLELTADLEQLMSSTEIGVVFLAEDCTVRRFNEPARDYFRVRDNDLGRPFDDIVTTLTYPNLAETVREVLEEDTRISRAVRNTAIPDQRLVVQISRYELARHRWGVLIAIVNITELELADEHRMLGAAIHDLSYSIMILSTSGVVEYANPQSALLRGLTNSGELIGTHLKEWATTDEQNAFGNAVRNQTGVARVVVDESGKALHCFVWPFTFDGVTYVGYRQAHLEDMLHSHELEHLSIASAELRGVSGEAIVGADGTVESSAGLTADQFPQNWSDAAEIGRKGFDSELHLAAFDAARGGKTAQVRERLMIDGKSVWAIIRYSPIENDPLGVSHPSGTVLVIAMDADETGRELHDLRNKNAKLQSQLLELKRSTGDDVALLAERNEDLDNFAHVAAHDLKAPVRSIRSFAEIALEELDNDSPAAPHLEKVIESSSRMGGLIDSLLDFASIGRDASEPKVIDLRRVVEDLTVDLRSSIQDANAEVEMEIVEPELVGDAEGIRQVIANLVQNSLKFTGSAPPRITISSSESDSGIVVSVQDNGIGFEQTEHERLFEPFQRLHGDQPGSGVGLAICRRIVQRHGGRIWASSEVDRGATFSFWIPK